MKSSLDSTLIPVAVSSFLVDKCQLIRPQSTSRSSLGISLPRRRIQAYKCYKTIELNKQEIGQLRFWCQYWILVALLTALGVFADIFFSWLPFYYGAKLGAFLYLWHPRTKGATFVYETYLGPFIAEHESEIDRLLFEFRARATDRGLIAWQMAANYLQTSVSEMMKYAISLMPAKKMNSTEPQEQQQAPWLSSAMPSVSVRQPAPSQQPRKEARFEPNPTKRQAREQPTKEAMSLLPSSAQSQETAPEIDSSETARIPTPAEEPIGDEESGSEPVEDSDQLGEETPV
ncbi:HVA22-like protein i isoform X1 [Zingiber officinale]|uniref:HVA22-like protein i isoform X1 n=1 Tax=Zingiber officinale TaxID=94328 RepID=UPI001C4CC402|nr:HVA22-like protein i isoform X1 [Zingiber officinale]